jgi:hypothetical protein
MNSADGSVLVAWVNERGQLRCMPGRCIDISIRRIHIEVPEQIPLRTQVRLSAVGKSLPGPNVVKYLTKCDSRFILMLESPV